MNITFMIGNGFDLNLGLHTSYKDFYKYYIKKEPNDLIAQSIKSNYNLWSDLELGLGVFLENIDETQIDNFLDSKALLEKHLSNYLNKENARLLIKDKNKLIEELKSKIPNFHKEFCLEDRQQYNQFKQNLNQKIHYQFINFNYTNTLDNIVNLAVNDKSAFSSHLYKGNAREHFIKSPIHIHGSLNENLILGIDNITQIKNPALQNNPDLTDYIIKTKVNEALGELKIEQTKNIINESKYICMFGLSIGDTDNYWWSYLIEWLSKDITNKLVLYTYDNTLVHLSAQEKLRYQNISRKNLVSKNINADYKKDSDIKKQIIVIHNSDIFNFSNIEIKIDEEEEKEKLSQAISNVSKLLVGA